MTDMEAGFYALILTNLVQALFWGLMVQRLVDKLMSRNYHEYKVAAQYKAKEPIVKVDNSPQEDFRTLNEVLPF